VAAGGDEAAAHEYDAGQGVDLRQLARVSRSSTSPSRQAAGSRALRRRHRKPAASTSAGTRANRSGWRGATRRRACGTRSRTRWKAESTSSSSPPTVLPATTAAARRTALEEAREALRDPPGLDGVELEVARHLHAVAGAPSARMRSAWASPCMRKRSTSESTGARAAARARSGGTSAARCGR